MEGALDRPDYVCLDFPKGAAGESGFCRNSFSSRTGVQRCYPQVRLRWQSSGSARAVKPWVGPHSKSRVQNLVISYPWPARRGLLINNRHVGLPE